MSRCSCRLPHGLAGAPLPTRMTPLPTPSASLAWNMVEVITTDLHECADVRRIVDHSLDFCESFVKCPHARNAARPEFELDKAKPYVRAYFGTRHVNLSFA